MHIFLHEDKRLTWATAIEVAWLSFTPTFERKLNITE